MRTFRKLCIWMQIILRFRNVILTRAREQSYHRKQKPSYSPATDQMPAENFMQWCTNVRCRMHEISSHRKSIWACVTGSMINVFHDQSASHRQTRWIKRVFIRNRFVGWSVVNVEHICGIKNIIFFSGCCCWIFLSFSQFDEVTHRKATRFIPQLHETSITSPFICLYRLRLGEWARISLLFCQSLFCYCMIFAHHNTAPWFSPIL